MDSQHAGRVQTGPPFETALRLLRRRERSSPLGTGSPELDRLVGGLEPGLFYLFYGDEDGGLPDSLIHGLLVEAVKEPDAKAVYVVCGNYRRSRTVMDNELLLSLIEAAGLDVDDALSRIHVVFAFSERHLMRVPRLVEGVLEGEEGFTLIAVQQLTKLFYGEHAMKHEDPAELTGVVARLREMCSEGSIVLAASGRLVGRQRPIPLPEGGTFLRHAANSIVFLRNSWRVSTTAYVVKHPDRARAGMSVRFGEGDGGFWAE
jgi:hypothetical protein